ncbi:MAG: hypothetical protein VX519_10930 [Myxococcota bacterium]|nr:hypothetical protein [Myxococcota bacterium]
MKISVLGTGRLGCALARDLASTGNRVTALSPSPPASEQVPALWMRCDAVTGEGLRAGLEGSDVVVYSAWSTQPKVAKDVAALGAVHAARVAREVGAERLVLLGPAGLSEVCKSIGGRARHGALAAVAERGPALVTLNLPVLFGHGDALLSPWIHRLSAGHSPRVPGGKHWIHPLWIQDAVRVIRLAIQGQFDGQRLEVLGPERWLVSTLVKYVCELEGRSPSRIPRRLGKELEAIIRDQDTADDDWERFNLGKRCRVSDWLAGRGR